MPPLLMLPTCSQSSGKYITMLATTTAISSTIWMERGVPPRMYPTLKSCNSSPATAEETQGADRIHGQACGRDAADRPSALRFQQGPVLSLRVRYHAIQLGHGILGLGR